MATMMLGSSSAVFEQQLGPSRRWLHRCGFALRRYRRDRTGREFSVIFDRELAVGMHCRYTAVVPTYAAIVAEAARFTPVPLRLALGSSPWQVSPDPDGRGWTVLRRDIPPALAEAVAAPSWSATDRLESTQAATAGNWMSSQPQAAPPSRA